MTTENIPLTETFCNELAPRLQCNAWEGLAIMKLVEESAR